jgi:hypothetical protein
MRRTIRNATNRIRARVNIFCRGQRFKNSKWFDGLEFKAECVVQHNFKVFGITNEFQSPLPGANLSGRGGYSALTG